MLCDLDFISNFAPSKGMKTRHLRIVAGSLSPNHILPHAFYFLPPFGICELLIRCLIVLFFFS